MQTLSCLFLVAISLLLSGCSGICPSASFGGHVVSPTHIAQFRGVGSMSTLWYRGSDENIIT